MCQSMLKAESNNFTPDFCNNYSHFFKASVLIFFVSLLELNQSDSRWVFPDHLKYTHPTSDKIPTQKRKIAGDLLGIDITKAVKMADTFNSFYQQRKNLISTCFGRVHVQQ